MDLEKHYRRLVRDLDGWSAATQVGPDRIRVSMPHVGRGRRTVTIVVTPAQWEDMYTVMHGSIDAAVDRVKRTLDAMQPHERFAVYADYGLEPSTEDALPDDGLPEAGLPAPGSGRWTAERRPRWRDGRRP